MHLYAKHKTTKKLLNASGLFNRYKDALYLNPPSFHRDIRRERNKTIPETDAVIIDEMRGNARLVYFNTKSTINECFKYLWVHNIS